MINSKWKPSENAPISCNYSEYNENGEFERNIYLEEGEKFPPTKHEGSYYKLI